MKDRETANRMHTNTWLRVSEVREMLAQGVGVLDHRTIKVVQVKHRTDYGEITRAAVVNVFKPQAEPVVRHRYRIA